jgi:type IV pilus assembly protein PilE
MHRNQRGFTLMELMVVIVIVAILAAVAVPLYINYVRDAQRTEARGAIGAVVTAEQTYFQQQGTYLNEKFVQNPTPATQTLNCDLTEALNNWTIGVTNASQTGFLVTATGINGAVQAGAVTLAYSRTAAPIWTP